MAESSWPSPDDGRVIDDAEFEKWAIAGGPSAVVGYTDQAVVYGDSSGRQVKVAAEKYAQVRGHTWYSGSSIVTKSIAANSSGSTRVDLVVLRLTRSTWNVTCEIVAGVPGAGAPSPTQDTGTTGVWELPIATVSVANGAATISAANVTFVAMCMGSDGMISVPLDSALTWVHSKFTGFTVYVADVAAYKMWNGSAWKLFSDAPILFARKASNQSVPNTTLNTDVTLQHPVVANATYHLELGVLYEATTAIDLKVLLRCPTGATFLGHMTHLVSAATGQQDLQVAAWSENTNNTFGGLGAGSSTWGYVQGTVLVGSTAGTVSLEFAQATSGATSVIVKTGSYLSMRRVA